MAKRKTKSERAIDAELQLEAEAVKLHNEEHLDRENEEPLHVEDKKAPHTYTRRLRKL